MPYINASISIWFIALKEFPSIKSLKNNLKIQTLPLKKEKKKNCCNSVSRATALRRWRTMIQGQPENTKGIRTVKITGGRGWNNFWGNWKWMILTVGVIV